MALRVASGIILVLSITLAGCMAPTSDGEQAAETPPITSPNEASSSSNDAQGAATDLEIDWPDFRGNLVLWVNITATTATNCTATTEIAGSADETGLGAWISKIGEPLEWTTRAYQLHPEVRHGEVSTMDLRPGQIRWYLGGGDEPTPVPAGEPTTWLLAGFGLEPWTDSDSVEHPALRATLACEDPVTYQVEGAYGEQAFGFTGRTLRGGTGLYTGGTAPVDARASYTDHVELSFPEGRVLGLVKETRVTPGAPQVGQFSLSTPEGTIDRELGPGPMEPILYQGPTGENTLELTRAEVEAGVIFGFVANLHPVGQTTADLDAWRSAHEG